MRESELIIACKEGSQRAFEEIYRLYSARLYGFCRRFSKSSDTAQEIVQDVFVRLWTHRDQIRSEVSLGAYIYTIARNQLIKHYRSTLRSAPYEAYVRSCDHIDCSNQDTNERVEYEDFLRIVRQASDRLPKTQRQVFDCCKLQQLPNAKVAQMLGLSEQTVKNQLSLALKQVKEELGPLFFFVLLLDFSVLF